MKRSKSKLNSTLSGWNHDQKVRDPNNRKNFLTRVSIAGIEERDYAEVLSRSHSSPLLRDKFRGEFNTFKFNVLRPRMTSQDIQDIEAAEIKVKKKEVMQEIIIGLKSRNEIEKLKI